MKLRLGVTNGVVQVLLIGPDMVADPDTLMTSRLARSAIADNNVTVTVDPATNLLSHVDATSKGRVADIVANVVRSVAFLQAGEMAVGITLYERSFALGEEASAAAGANAALASYLDRTCGAGAAAAALAAGADDKPRQKICSDLAGYGLTTGTAASFIRVASALPGPARRDLKPTDYARCLRGICYRPLRPARVTLDVGTVYSETRDILVPNEQLVAFVDLSSGVFAQQKYTLAFTGGMLTSYQQEAQSELVGLARLPGDIIGGLLSGTTEALGLRSGAVAAESTLLTTLTANAQAQSDAAKACREHPGVCNPAGFSVIRFQLGTTPEQGRAGDSGGRVKPDGGDDGQPSGQDG